MGAVRTVRNGTIVIKDGSGTPKTVTATFDGELSWRQTKNYVQIFDRGTIDHLRPGPDACVEVSFNMLAQDLYEPSTSSTVTVYNALTHTGATLKVGSEWVSTKVTSDVWHVDIQVTITDPAGGAAEVITFEDCAVTSIEYTEAEEGNKITFTAISCATAPTFA